MLVDLTDEQAVALERVMSWIETAGPMPDGGAPYLRLGGYAGTGKTTLVRHVVEAIGVERVAVCAYTGKAAHVLRTKGIGASTIHSLIYDVEVRCNYCGFELNSDEACQRTARCPTAGKHLEFKRGIGIAAEIIIVDEASMVDSRIHRDLRGFGKPILYVGDHGQLEPIGDNPRLMVDPEIRLETIHRQVADSPILKFAHRVRNHGEPETAGDDARVLQVESVPQDAAEYDVVLVGRNTTRKAVNNFIRAKRGFSGPLPQPGERIVCLRNSHDQGVFNGMLLTVLEVRADDKVDRPEIDGMDDEGNVLCGLRFEPAQFGSLERLDDTSRRVALFDFGYALTVHKAQGSEWPRVLVLEWIHPETPKARWRYTAATRASQQLVWCVKPKGRR